MQDIFNRFFVLGLAFLATASLWAQQNQDHIAYIERYNDIAIREMERAGVPASIKLAQGILESDAGKSFLARRANNHFGIKCGRNWRGKEVYREDDDYDDRGKLIKSCFRSYKSVEASYVAHSEFLRDPRKTFRYGFLFQLDPKNYRRWAHGLKKAGYATSATYPQKLITIIERYELYDYDNRTTLDIDTPTEVITSNILRNNDVQYTLSAGVETVEELARRTDIAVRNLIKYNEHLSESTQELEADTRVYLQPKRSSYRGKQTYHVVEPGETMFDISQRYAIRLDKLYTRNLLTSPQQPAVNERIKIRGGKVRTAPKQRAKNEPKPIEPTPKPIEPEVVEETGILDMEEDPDTSPAEVPAPRPPVIVPSPRPTTPPSKPSTTGSSPNADVPVIIVGGTSTTTTSKPTTTSPTPTQKPTKPASDTDFEEDIFEGESDVVPTNKPTTTVTKPSVPVNDRPTTTQITHRVKKGDTLYNIARRYNTDVATIKRLNKLAGTNINIDQILRIK